MFHLGELLLQALVILAVARGVGLLFRRIHQPQVIGEMLAGIMLGPSLLGWLAPGVSAALFPPESLDYLNALSQVGVLLFMFLVGLELNPHVLRGQGKAAVITSWSSIVTPFVLGILLALVLYPRLGAGLKGFLPFALFMGTAMSITAFPVLARIMAERDLLRTRVGSMTIACAAVDDVSAWFLLACVVVLVRAGDSGHPIWITVLGSLAFVAFLVFVVRGMLRRLEDVYQQRRRISENLLAIILLLVLASAYVTEWLGIHALFGAFLMGAILPKEQRFVHALTEKLEGVAVVLLLPLFFAYNGMRVSIGLLSGAELWVLTLAIIATAVLGKWGGSAVAGRATGMPWREASAVGILMNTRGLVELVILNIGLDLGVISPTLFAMMVLMALVTTFMTSPLLDWLYVNPMRRARAANTVPEAAA
jgi:Kef-type K+ transport system membrane component KefB